MSGPHQPVSWRPVFLDAHADRPPSPDEPTNPSGQVTKRVDQSEGSDGAAESHFLDARIPSKPDFVQASSKAGRILAFLEWWVVQCLFFGAPIALFAVFLGWQLVTHDTLFDLYQVDVDTTQKVVLVHVPFVTVIVSSVLAELLVRVEAQSGPVRKAWSWPRFAKPWYHKLEVLCILVLIYRIITFGYLLVVVFLQLTIEADVYDTTSEILTLLVFVFHRLLRWGGIFQNISVQTSEEKSYAWENRERVWLSEHEERRREYDSRWPSRLQTVVNHPAVQWYILVVSVVHVVMFYSHRLWGDFVYELLLCSTWLVCMLFTVEFVVRCYAQDGERFFLPKLHRAEICCLTVIWIETIRSTPEPRSSMKATVGSASMHVAMVAILFHRFLRFIALWFGVSASEWDPDSPVDAQAFAMFMKACQGLLEVAPQNVNVELATGIELFISKAKLNPELLQRIHLPLTVVGGVLEELQCTMPQHNKLFVKERKATQVRVKNLLLLVAPGPGLAEAGGLGPQGYWTFENAVEMKSNLIELLAKRMSAPTAANTTEVGATAPSFRSRVRNLARAIGQRVNSTILNMAVGVLQVRIDNIRVQFDDHLGVLGLGQFSVGSTLDYVRLDHRSGEVLSCCATRIGVFIDIGRQNSGSQISRRFIREPPRRVMRDFHRNKTSERFRMAAFEVLNQQRSWTARARHRCIERWPERNLVFSLTRLSLNAVPAKRSAETIRNGCFDVAIEDEDLLQEGKKRREGGIRFRTRKRTHSKSQDASPGTSEWKWCLRLSPLRINFDEDQSRCVKVLLSCLTAWTAHDQAFKWRPDDSIGERREHLSDVDVSTISRLWWIYAIHLVLAKQGRKPRAPWMGLAWRATNHKRYMSLLTEIALRPGTTVAAMSTLGTAQKWERRWAQELQVRLNIEDCLQCRKNAMGVVAQKKAPERMSVRQTVQMESFSHILERLETLGTLLSEEEEQEEQQQEEDDTFTTDSSFVTLVRAKLAGVWSLELPSFECCVLQSDIRARPVVINVGMTGLLASFRISVCPEAAMSSHSLGLDANRERTSHPASSSAAPMTYNYTLTVRHFIVWCPDVPPEFRFHGSRYIFRVTKPLEFSFGDLVDHGHGNIGEHLHFLMTANHTGRLERIRFRIPDIRIVLYVPLMTRVIGILSPSAKAAVQHSGAVTSGGPARGRHCRPFQGGPLIVKSGRYGPMNSTVTVTDDTECSKFSLAHTSFHSHVAKIYSSLLNQQKIIKRHRMFERLCGFVPTPWDHEFDMSVGAVHVVQVGEYFQRSVLLEQYMVWPFESVGCRGALRGPHRLGKNYVSSHLADPQFSEHKFVMEANGFFESVMPVWDHGVADPDDYVWRNGNGASEGSGSPSNQAKTHDHSSSAPTLVPGSFLGCDEPPFAWALLSRGLRRKHAGESNSSPRGVSGSPGMDRASEGEKWAEVMYNVVTLGDLPADFVEQACSAWQQVVNQRRACRPDERGGPRDFASL